MTKFSIQAPDFETAKGRQHNIEIESENDRLIISLNGRKCAIIQVGEATDNDNKSYGAFLCYDPFKFQKEGIVEAYPEGIFVADKTAMEVEVENDGRF